MKPKFIIGAGGHGRVVLEAWRAAEPGQVFRFLDDDVRLHGEEILGVLVEGPVSSPSAGGSAAVIAIGNNQVRMELARRWSGRFAWGKVCHPTAAIAPSAVIGSGTLVGAGAIVNSGASIGAHVIINSGAVVEHDCVIEDGAAVSPGACMGGRVRIGERAFISTGVTLAPRIRIGAGTVVGAGSVVVKDLPSGVLAYGVPARPVRDLDATFDWRRLL